MMIVRFVILVLLPLANSALDCGHVKVRVSMNLMVGSGTSFVDPGQWPWLAPLFYNGEYGCSSSLITKRHLLTAAHCVIFPDNPKSYSALLGRHNISDRSETNWVNRTMSAVYIHDGYNANTQVFKSKDDIAVFTMSLSVEFSDHIQPVCLPPSTVGTADITGTAVGHGWNEDRRVESVARQAEQTTIGALECMVQHSYHNKGVSVHSFCASSSTATPCRGDSGGGYYVFNGRTYSTYGVLSQGLNRGSCRAGDFAVFVEVPKYIDWIRDKVALCGAGEDCVDPCDLNPCAANADCQTVDDKYTCTCRAGFEGDAKVYCHPATTTPRPDFCSLFNCGPNAKCTDFGAFATCSCLDDFIGSPPNCHLECSSNIHCPSNKACAARQCLDLCQSQPCGDGECKAMGHERTCECQTGQRYNEDSSQCELNPHLIDGHIRLERCCDGIETANRQIRTLRVECETKIDDSDYEVDSMFASNATGKLSIIGCDHITSVLHLPIKLRKVLPKLLTYKVHKTGVNRVRRLNLEGLHELQFLTFATNKIKDIDVDAFEDLESVRFLDLKSNKLESLSDQVFSKNLKLEDLNLSYNQLMSITPELIRDLRLLTLLQLQGNQLTTLDPHVFDTFVDLKKIWLHKNKLTTLPDNVFGSNSKLVKVGLAYNNISRLNPRVFEGKPDLTFVELTFNTCINKKYGSYTSPARITLGKMQELKRDIEGNCSVLLD